MEPIHVLSPLEALSVADLFSSDSVDSAKHTHKNRFIHTALIEFLQTACLNFTYPFLYFIHDQSCLKISNLHVRLLGTGAVRLGDEGHQLHRYCIYFKVEAAGSRSCAELYAFR